MPIRLTPRALFRRILVLALVAFFLAGSAGNVILSSSFRADYARWGYPDWFHYITGALEFAAAIGLAREATRKIGIAIGGVAMGGALVTLLIHAETLHALAPAAVLLGLLACLLLDAKARAARWECKVF